MTPPEPSGYRKAKSKGPRCGTCAYFNDGHCSMWATDCAADHVCDEYTAATREVPGMKANRTDRSVQATILSDSAQHASILYLADGDLNERDGLIWATVLPVGEWQLTPDPHTGRPVNKPLRVIEGRSDDARQAVGLADLLEAWQDKAVQHVTIPLSHADRPEENTGYIRDLRIEQDAKLGVRALRAGFDFTEPDIKGKVKRGTIAGRSCGILFDYADKKLGKKWKAVLGHVALTNKPWIAGMPSFAADFNASETSSYLLTAATDDRTELERVTDRLDELSDGALELVSLSDGVAVVRDEDGDTWEATVRDGQLEDPSVWDQLPPMPLTNEAPKGGDQMGKYDNLTPEQLLATLEEQDARLAVAEMKDREAAIDGRITELSEQFPNQPGLMRVAREIMLADDGDTALNLSENGKPVQVTASDVVERMLAAIEVGDLHLGEQQEERSTGGRPANDGTKLSELTARQRADEYRAGMGIQTDLIAT